MARTDWQYVDSRYAAHGTMRCNACGKPVQGQYRVRDGRAGFVLMHRACSADDPKWARLDIEADAREVRADELRRAAIAFRKRWGVSELDELIESLGGEDGTEEG